jgi:hypothetical protein
MSFELIFMTENPESAAAELRGHPGIKDVDVVQFPSRKELWVVLREPVNVGRLQRASADLGFTVATRGSFASKLPRSLAEMIWDGVTHEVRGSGGRTRLGRGGSALVAKIAKDLATGDTVYHVNDNDGLKVLLEYLKS